MHYSGHQPVNQLGQWSMNDYEEAEKKKYEKHLLLPPEKQCSITLSSVN